jgi:hypothetical protein
MDWRCGGVAHIDPFDQQALDLLGVENARIRRCDVNRFVGGEGCASKANAACAVDQRVHGFFLYS